jgi:hypothetical protein
MPRVPMRPPSCVCIIAGTANGHRVFLKQSVPFIRCGLRLGFGFIAMGAIKLVVVVSWSFRQLASALFF